MLKNRGILEKGKLLKITLQHNEKTTQKASLQSYPVFKRATFVC